MLMPSSEKWGSNDWDYGKYPAKIYTIDGVLIYQVENGDDNNAKSPLGGVIVQSSPALSMLDAIVNPITLYHGSGTLINQVGHSRDLYNYYWTSYSRGTDGANNNTTWHNAYLDGYIPLRVKSIYDPCPYLYRIPSNGTYNQFTNQRWIMHSYIGGVSCNINSLGTSWLPSIGRRRGNSSVFEATGGYVFFLTATVCAQTAVYTVESNASSYIGLHHINYHRSSPTSVRCIEVTRRYAHTFCQQKVCKNCRAS